MYINPKLIISDFLRVNLTDPRSRSETINTESLTADAAQTTFSLTAPSGKVSCVTAITVDAVAKVKWRDYYPDQRNENIIFFTAMTGAEAVNVTYKHGTTNWIYDDKPNVRLNATSFPRLDVMLISAPGSRLGNVDAPIMSNLGIQIDIWTKEKQSNQIFTIENNVYSGNNLAEYIAHKIHTAITDNEDDLYPALHDIILSQSPAPELPFNEEYQAFHKVVEFTVNGIDVGTVE